MKRRRFIYFFCDILFINRSHILKYIITTNINQLFTRYLYYETGQRNFYMYLFDEIKEFSNGGKTKSIASDKYFFPFWSCD